MNTYHTPHSQSAVVSLDRNRETDARATRVVVVTNACNTSRRSGCPPALVLRCHTPAESTTELQTVPQWLISVCNCPRVSGTDPSMDDPAALAGMLSFDSMGLYEQPKSSVPHLRVPRVVPDQKTKFGTDEFLQQLSREKEVRYTGYRDRPLEERQVRFQNGCREGHAEIAFTATGTNLQLVFAHSPYNDRECDFQKERGKVHIVSRFIMNGVCVRWRGWLDLERLDGAGCLEYDEERAALEDAALREQIERYNQRLREFEDKQRAYREHGDELRMHAHHAAHAQHAHAPHAPRCHQQTPRQPAHAMHALKQHSQGSIIS